MPFMPRDTLYVGSLAPAGDRDLSWPEIPAAQGRALEADILLAERELLSSLGRLLEKTADICHLLHSAIVLSCEIHSLPARRQGKVAASRLPRRDEGSPFRSGD
jgi:hypothetical protein